MNKINLSAIFKTVLFFTVLVAFTSCGDDDEEIHSNHIVGKWHIASTSSDRLIFNSNNTGLWIHGSEKKEFTWRTGEASNAITVFQKFPDNENSEWILSFNKDECSKNVLNGFYETYTYNVGYINNKANSVIKLIRHAKGCSYVDYIGPSDWDNYDDNNVDDGDEDSDYNDNGNSGNDSEGDNDGGSSNHHYPCKSCNETGDCWNCFGSGTDPITNKKCNTCHGTGKCQICHGKGYINV